MKLALLALLTATASAFSTSRAALPSVRRVAQTAPKAQLSMELSLIHISEPTRPY